MSPKIETQKELTTENQIVGSFQGAPGGGNSIVGYRVFSLAIVEIDYPMVSLMIDVFK